MGGCFPLFYYQYSTSGGRVQADSSIFRSGRLNFEQSAPASTLIPDKGIPALDNPILDSPAACKAANRRETGEEVPGSRTKRRLLGAGHTPQVGEIPNKPGKVAVWGFWRVWRGVVSCYSLCSGSGQVIPTSGHVRNK